MTALGSIEIDAAGAIDVSGQSPIETDDAECGRQGTTGEPSSTFLMKTDKRHNI